MSELQPPEEDHLTTAPPPQLLPQQQTQATTSLENTKRQRRPSVRLGEIGNQPYVSTWKVPHTKPSSKTRPLTNLANNGNVASSNSYEKPIKRKRARTNWSSTSSKMEEKSFVNESDAFREEHQELEDEEDHLPLEEENDTNNDEYWGKSADGVREWLIGLGLGRYAPVFEIHEVDDEVLPLLTLEDLKDMGINAVGSRRKMYTAIQKLRKGFS